MDQRVTISVRNYVSGGLAYWLRSLLPQFVFGGVTNVEDRDAPAVLVHIPGRPTVVFLRTGSVGQAERAATRYRDELSRIGADEFLAKYKLHAPG